MKIYMMIIGNYPSIALCDKPPVKNCYARYCFKSKVNAFGIIKSKEPDLFNYLTNTFNIPDSDKGFIEVEL